MKKGIFCAVALMIGAVGLAQTDPNAPTAPPQSPGLSPMAPAPATANRAKSDQWGNDNKVQMSQVGTAQGAYNNQDDGTGSGGNQARFIQTGNVQAASGVKNYADNYQRGTKNKSNQMQYGDHNESYVQQGNTDDGSEKNRAQIQQGAAGAQQAERNKASIAQNGDDNQARTQQNFDRNEALTMQDGDNNYADINQNAKPNGGKGHEAEIDQDGNDNDAWIDQTSNSGGSTAGWNSATAVQDGVGNFSYQQQEATSAGGEDNNALVAQGPNGAIRALGNTVGVGLMNDLLGVDNIFNGPLSLTSNNSRAFQFQKGDGGNVVVAGQFGDKNYSEQHQDGTRNHALVEQNAFGNPAGGENYARQDQMGDRNEAGIGQNGLDQRAYQYQNGDRNVALSTQRGHDNDVNTHQIGDRNYAQTAQRGQCNDILVVQYDGQSAVVQQNVPGGLPGGNNTANIFQAGPGGGAAIDCDFDSKLPKDPRNPIAFDPIPNICPGC